MKKVILSVLFSSVFFVSEAKNLKVEIIKTDTPCARIWVQDVENLMYDFCATYEQAVVIADRNFEACLDDMYGN